jgi:hypothetical protein
VIEIGEDDISHLCSNVTCCRPSHLHRESHSINMSRIGCPGLIVMPDYSEYALSLCTHTPRCMKYSVPD